MMNILFLILFVCNSQLVHMVAVHQQLGISPYKFGGTKLCLVIHQLLLVTCIQYCGWLYGIILFLLHYFGLIHATIGWILDIRSLFFNDVDQIYKHTRFCVAMLTPAIIVEFIFCVLSFFLSQYKSLFYVFRDNVPALIAILALSVLCSIFRRLIFKSLEDEDSD